MPPAAAGPDPLGARLHFQQAHILRCHQHAAMTPAFLPAVLDHSCPDSVSRAIHGAARCIHTGEEEAQEQSRRPRRGAPPSLAVSLTHHPSSTCCI